MDVKTIILDNIKPGEELTYFELATRANMIVQSPSMDFRAIVFSLLDTNILEFTVNRKLKLVNNEN